MSPPSRISDVVRFPSGATQHPSHLLAEIALHFEDQAADLAIRIARSPTEELFGVGIHAGRRFSRADRTDNHHARVEPSLRDREPCRRRCTSGCRFEMRLAEHERGCRPSLWRHVRRERPRAFAFRIAVGDDCHEGRDDGQREEWRREPERRVAVDQHEEHRRTPQLDQLQIDVAPIDRIGVDAEDAHTRREQHRNHGPLFEQSSEHGNASLVHPRANRPLPRSALSLWALAWRSVARRDRCDLLPGRGTKDSPCSARHAWKSLSLPRTVSIT